MEIAVIGGTGHLGARVAEELAARGHAVRAVSRTAPAPGRLPAGVAHRRADLATGDGLDAALAGAAVVVNAVGDRRGRAAVLVEGTRRLLEAERRAGVAHHVAISIVGADRTRIRYHRATVAQEQVVIAGPVPWTILRATQFHTLVDEAFALLAARRLLPRGRGLLQPIDPAVVASWLADAVDAGPAGRLPDIAGPEVATVTELARQWRRGRPGRLLPLPVDRLGAAGRALRAGALIDRDAAVSGPTFAQWLDRERAGVQPLPVR